MGEQHGVGGGGYCKIALTLATVNRAVNIVQQCAFTYKEAVSKYRSMCPTSRGGVKLKFHDSSFPRSILARISPQVGRVSEDVTRMLRVNCYRLSLDDIFAVAATWDSRRWTQAVDEAGKELSRADM